ncbi:MAG: glycosyltransferase [Candidatus Micrarchaeota archaeon]|nr:glycosyltransferase [Candidatus Micrarchaeota archaeon]
MRIAFFTDTYLPNKDGVVTSILTSRSRLEKMGHEVYVFCSGTREAKRENRDPRVFYHASAPFAPYPDYQLALFPFLSRNKLKKLNIDLVHSHGLATMGLAAAVSARAIGKPLVTTFHTLIPEAVHYIARGRRMERLTKSIAWKYVTWYLGLADCIITPSGIVREMLEDHGLRNVYAVPNGIDTRVFNPKVKCSEVKKELGIEGKKMVLNVGRLVKEKNLDVLIKSALIVLEGESDAVFVVAGGGPAEAYYRALVRKEGVEDKFIFKGYLSRDLLAKYYAAADVFAFPSKFETQGLVALEAMACGTPVAGAEYLAIKEIVKSGYNGYLFDPDDHEDCAEKLLKTMRDRSSLSKNARRTATQYSLEKCAEKMVDVYEKAFELFENKGKKR